MRGKCAMKISVEGWDRFTILEWLLQIFISVHGYSKILIKQKSTIAADGSL